MSRKTLPAYRKQKSKSGDRAFVELSGSRVYLGAHGSDASRERYARAIAEWEGNGRHLPIKPHEITVLELVAQFWEHAATYYRFPDGTQSAEIVNLRAALRPLVTLYGSTTAASFGPKSLKATREWMIASDASRGYINSNVQRIRSVFKWAVSEELIPGSVYEGLRAVVGLKRGRSEARETAAVAPVPEAHIEAVRPLVSRQVVALIDLQLLTGARAGELVKLHPIDLDTTGRVWSYSPIDHKCAFRGHSRTILFGPRAQRVLEPFLASRSVDAYLFNPKDAETERHAKAAVHRRQDQKPNPRRTDRKLGDHYTTSAYRRAIHRACDLANLPKWGPHRLRHNAGTRLRKDYGIELSQTVLGHRLGSSITEVYSESNMDKAVAVMAEAG